MADFIETYLQKIEFDFQGGKATEYTYRTALEGLLEALAPQIDATSDPKHIQCGAPDFIVERRKIPLGYVETKDIGTDLDKVEKSAQLKRYRQALNNLILTDYLEFRWYVSGEPKLTARLATLGKNKKLVRDPAGIALAQKLLTAFYETAGPTITTPKELAERMAQLTKLVRDLTFNALQTEAAETTGALHQQYKTFRDFLLPNLQPLEFADIYAQTMAYGLFAARVSAPAQAVFNRASAYQHLSANRFLRKLFLDVGEELETALIAPFLDDLAALLLRAEEALKDFGKHTRTEDPVVHFYETFLAAYDPQLRERRGVYYTPAPVVQFIVNAVDQLLRTRFKRAPGLAAKDVYVLDPATGTSTFLYYTVRLIHATLLRQKQGGSWQTYVHSQLLPRLLGFELLVAPYVIAHLKLGLLLRELGYTWGKDDRLRVFLTNALEEGVTPAETLGDLGWYISQEASEAAQAKKNAPIMVIFGNPPYAKASANRAPWIEGLMADYKTTVRNAETQIQALSDDYVKFIRFAQWRIQKTGSGIVSFITNNGYLDGPLFRDMRQSLLETFGEIWILNLHGDTRKQETSPTGALDQNVFDIQQGVAIIFLVCQPQAKERAIYYANLWGEREAKYTYLAQNNLTTVAWAKLTPAAPQYLFVPLALEVQPEWERAVHVYDMFGTGQRQKDNHVRYGAGFVTQQDEFAIAFEPQTLYRRVAELLVPDTTEKTLREKYQLCTTNQWNFHRARKELANVNLKPLMRQVAYRPFDFRYTLFNRHVNTIQRERIMRQLEPNNLALLLTRRITHPPFTNVFVTDKPVEYKIASHDRNTIVFPLYFYSDQDPDKPKLFSGARQPNFSPQFIADIEARLQWQFIADGPGNLKSTVGPEDIFYYTYAILHASAYRARYAALLQLDFPRVPLTSDKKLFAKLVGKGAALVSLHLLKAPQLEHFITSFPVTGSNLVDKVRYEKKKVWINAEQYFGGLPEAVWQFKIGGYPVCEKWLKDRKGRTLSHEDIAHYQQVIVALKETLRVMAEIDKAIPGFPLP